MVTGTLVTDLMKKKFSQTKFGTDRELAIQERWDAAKEAAAQLHNFRKNPKGVRRVRVAL